jgi:hypothetical protein
MATKACDLCGQQIDQEAMLCPHCHASQAGARSVTQIILIALAAMWGVCILGALGIGALGSGGQPTPTAIRAATAAAAALIDVRRWYQRPIAEFQAEHGQPTETIPIAPGKSVAAPAGGQRQVFQQPWGTLEVDVEQGLVVSVNLFFDEPVAQTYMEALRLIGMPTDRPADLALDPAIRAEGPAIRVWYDLEGMYVGLTARSAADVRVIHILTRRPKTRREACF